MKRAYRPRNLSYNVIDQASAEQEVEWMEALINAIDSVVEQSG